MESSTIERLVPDLVGRLNALADDQAAFIETIRRLRTGQSGGYPAAQLPEPLLQVYPLPEPHRPTRRNYDYFEQLDLALAALAADQQRNDSDAGGTPAG